MIDVYNVKLNPKFQNGELTQEQILNLFLEHFAIHQHTKGIVIYDFVFLFYIEKIFKLIFIDYI